MLKKFARILLTLSVLTAHGQVRELSPKLQARQAAMGKVEILVRGSAASATTLNSNGLTFRAMTNGKRTRAVTHRRFARFQATANGGNADAAVAALRAQGVDAQPNRIYHSLKLPTDPKFGQQWGLKNTGQLITPVVGGSGVDNSVNPPTNGTGLDIGAEPAWDLITDCSSVVVAVIDSGVRSTHQDLIGNLWDDGAGNFGFDFADNDNDPQDELGHGTHVAATIAAAANNSFGGTGVCWKSKIMAVRVISRYDSATTADVADGIYYAVDRGAKVINMSLGGKGSDSVLEEAVKYAEDHDVVVVAAAGNNGDDNDAEFFVPANYTGDAGLSVAAVRQDFSIATFSNFGKTTVDVAAPGSNIYSAIGAELDTNDPAMDSGWSFQNFVSAVLPGQPAPNAMWGWAYSIAQGQAYDNIFSNVKNYDDDGAPNYKPNSKDYVYRTADLRPMHGWPAADTTTYLGLEAKFNLHPSDRLDWRCSPSPVADPPTEDFLAGPDGQAVGTASLNSQGVRVLQEGVVPSSCRTATATIGYQLISDGASEARGVSISSSTVTHVHALTARYDVYQGTSMATPHVAGVAAMVRAYRPYATAKNVVAAIKAGARPVDALKTKTVSGGVVNALGALSVLVGPTNVTAVVEK